MSIRIDPERFHGLLATREGKKKSAISDFLYRVPASLGGKAPPQSAVEFLAGLPALAGLAKKELCLLASAMHERSFGDGEVIFEQGTPSGALYLIRSGCVALSRKTDGTDGALASLGPNELFGELALLLDDAPRQITATSRGLSDLLALSRPDFDSLVEKSPVVGMKIFRALARLVALRFIMLMEEIESASSK